MASKLSTSPDIFTESKDASYYDNNSISKQFSCQLLGTSHKNILGILKGLNPPKATVTNNLLGKCLNDGADVLARPIFHLFNLFIKPYS